MYDTLVRESDALAAAYRQAGVKVIRNESGQVPDAIVKYYGDWLPDKYLSFYGQAVGGVVGNCYIHSCDFWLCMQMELEYREAMLEIFENNKDAVIGLPDNALWTPLPKPFQDWEVIKIDPEEFKLGVCSNVPLNSKQIAIVQGARKFARELEKRGYTPVEVPYSNSYQIAGSGMHCSTCSVWREYD